jgi:PAS domain S-box-containing protein
LAKDTNAPVLRFETRLLHKDGSWRTFKAVGSNLVHNNVVESVIVNYRDITELKRAEKELVESEEKFRLSFTTGLDAYYWATLEEGKIIEVGPVFEDVFGFTRDEVIGKTTLQLNLYHDATDRTKIVSELKAKGFVKDLELKANKKDKKIITVSFSASKVLINNQMFILGVIRDITKRKQVEEALRDSDERFRSMIQSLSDMIFILDGNDQLTYESPSVTRILGYQPGYFIGKSLFTHIHPDDLDQAMKALDEVFLSVNPGIPTEFRYQKADDTWIYLEALGNNQFENPGIKGIVITVRDITERKQAESQRVDALDALRKSEDKYRTLIETTDTGYVIIDQDGLVRDANSEYVRLSGHHDLSEIVGRSVMEWTAESEIEKNTEAVKACFDKGYIRNLEIDYVDAKGNITPIEINATCTEIEGKIHTITICRDITERKKAEDKLQQTLESLRKAIGTTIQVLVSASESRDPYTAGHQSRTANLACAIATEMELAQEKIEGIRMAGSIHDIGKLSIPAEILSKPTKLSEIEFSLIKEHARSGYEMLKDVESPWPLAEIVYQHHERMNGSGYPRNLKGDEILIESQILAVADVMEAMASHRPYRPSLGIEAALEEIEKNKGILYAAAAADACLRLFREKGYQLI